MDALVAKQTPNSISMVQPQLSSLWVIAFLLIIDYFLTLGTLVHFNFSVLSLPESVKKTFRYGLIKSFISLPDKTQLAFNHHFATISLNRNNVFAIILLIFPKRGFRGLTIVLAKASCRFSFRLCDWK